MPKNLLVWLFFLALAITLFLYLNAGQAPVSIPTNVAIQQLTTGNVRTLSIEPDRLTGEFRVPQQVGTRRRQVVKFQCALPRDHGSGFELVRYLLDHSGGAEISIINKQSISTRIFALPKSIAPAPATSKGTAP